MGLGFLALGFAHPVQAIPSALAVGLGLVALARRACVRPLRGLKGLASRAAASSCSMHLLRLRAGSQLPDGVAVGVGAGLDGSDAPALGLLLRCLLLHDALDQLLQALGTDGERVRVVRVGGGRHRQPPGAPSPQA